MNRRGFFKVLFAALLTPFLSRFKSNRPEQHIGIDYGKDEGTTVTIFHSIDNLVVDWRQNPITWRHDGGTIITIPLPTLDQADQRLSAFLQSEKFHEMCKSCVGSISWQSPCEIQEVSIVPKSPFKKD